MQLEQIIGDTTPNLPYIPPPPKCNAIAMIVMIAVTAFVSFYVPGLVGGPAFISGFIGGFAGSVAGQVTGKALGVVETFSLRSALVSGITQGFAQGMAEKLKTFEWAQKIKLIADTGKLTVGGKMVMAAASVGVNWAANQLVGNNSVAFSWRNVVTSAAAAGVIHSVGEINIGGAGAETTLGDAFDSFIENNQLLGGTAQNFLSAATSWGVKRGIYGSRYKDDHWNFKQMAMDAFGNALGSSLATQIAKYEKKQNDIAELAARADLDPKKLTKKQLTDIEEILAVKNDKDSTVEERREASKKLMLLKGATDEEANKVLGLYDKNIFSNEKYTKTSVKITENGQEIGSDKGSSSSVFGSTYLDNMAIGVGETASYIEKNVSENPFLKYGLTAIDIAAGPVAFAARELFSASPLGKFLESKQAELLDLGANKFKEAGHSNENAVYGALGALVVVGVVVSGATALLKSLHNLNLSGRFGAAKKQDRVDESTAAIPNTQLNKPRSTKYDAEQESGNIHQSQKPTEGGAPNKLTSSLIDDAKSIISSSSKGQLKKMAALSQAGVDELGIVSKKYTNLPGSATDFPGVRRLNDDFFVIEDQAAYIKKVEELYEGSGNTLNPVTRARILEHVGDGTRQFPTQAGIPGLHAEVQSVNSVINQVPVGFDLSRINVSTIKLYPSKGQGLPFPACHNCGGILSNTVNILTGIK